MLVWLGTDSVRKVLATHRRLSLTGLLLLGLCLLRLGHPSQTWGQQLDESSLYSVAVQAYQDGLLDLARDQLQMYLSTYPQGTYSAEVHYLLGDYFFRKGSYTQASHYVRDALQGPLSEGSHADAHYLLGRSSIEIGQYAEALEALKASS